jgi:hypothetical protein
MCREDFALKTLEKFLFYFPLPSVPDTFFNLMCIEDFVLGTLENFLFCFPLPPVPNGGGHSGQIFSCTEIFMIKYY